MAGAEPCAVPCTAKAPPTTSEDARRQRAVERGAHERALARQLVRERVEPLAVASATQGLERGPTLTFLPPIPDSSSMP